MAATDDILPEPGARYARLRHVLALVDQIAGRDRDALPDLADESGRVGGAYADASPFARRRFETLAAEVSAWAAAGVDALALDPARRPRAAAARMADELEDALADLARLLRV